MSPAGFEPATPAIRTATGNGHDVSMYVVITQLYFHMQVDRKMQYFHSNTLVCLLDEK